MSSGHPCDQCVVSIAERTFGRRSYEYRVALAATPKCCKNDITTAIAVATKNMQREADHIEAEFKRKEEKSVAQELQKLEPIQELPALPKLEMRGVFEHVTRIRSNYQSTLASVARMNDELAGLAADADAVALQARKHREDLRFDMAGGNSAGSDDSQKTEG